MQDEKILFALDLQDLNIELTLHMMNNTNPFTDIRYGEDPVLIFIELQNEDEIYWGTIMESLKQTPTYKALMSRQFSIWLREKYGSRENLEKTGKLVKIRNGALMLDGRKYKIIYYRIEY